MKIYKSYIYILFFFIVLPFIAGSTSCGSGGSSYQWTESGWVWLSDEADDAYVAWMTQSEDELQQSGKAEMDFKDSSADRLLKDYTEEYPDDSTTNLPAGEGEEVSARSEDAQRKFISTDFQSLDTFKRTPGYLNVRGVLISPGNIEINNLIKVHGGVYTLGELTLGDGAIIVEDSTYIRSIVNDDFFNKPLFEYNGAFYNDRYSSEPNFEKNKIIDKPIGFGGFPSKVRLLNPYEVTELSVKYDDWLNPKDETK